MRFKCKRNKNRNFYAMADKPHRAIVLYGDGLLIDSADKGTTTDSATCPSLHALARKGCSGFLALRNVSPQGDLPFFNQ